MNMAFMEVSHTVDFEEVLLNRITDLRRRVLRAGRPLDKADFEGDNDKNTHHFAAIADSRVIGCASFFHGQYSDAPAWKLRGLAVDEDYRGSGMNIGSKLLIQSIIALTEKANVRTFWCNAPETAVLFLKKNGWRVTSDEFNLPPFGRHFEMMRLI